MQAFPAVEVNLLLIIHHTGTAGNGIEAPALQSLGKTQTFRVVVSSVLMAAGQLLCFKTNTLPSTSGSLDFISQFDLLGTANPPKNINQVSAAVS